MSAYLTPPELEDLTGYKIKSAVLRWLDRHKWPYVVGGADGWPRVLRQYRDQRLLGMNNNTVRRKAEPNWTKP
ncbi:DUF4224 domain-containing protein [Neopusillimonas maritima]|jgi:hypothetical protein|uniref:DUF4224 domain-containing protein n=1 Tax=Neopusillimonas maritima TaxID=2026239 RepID=A0ABX9MW99_9BURK|nr:hypothetical protein [Alcaligenaceae bacterium]MAO49650.1 hypothetical protein [Pusillimonas sp.]RII82851.1 hypothetical protein CJO09_09745 [Neopusillimonas maritima]MBC42271.1 hypothetical protein [Pusillimonas sp.]HBT34108.1 hypothetical protein [Pusillimonas sp.]|tara:strand:- start:439 stop:657 length:219 start_codon:yes stop_codon:yes gene_type:complete